VERKNEKQKQKIEGQISDIRCQLSVKAKAKDKTVLNHLRFKMYVLTAHCRLQTECSLRNAALIKEQ